MAKIQRSSSNAERHGYMKGYRFWVNQQFWHDPARMFSQAAKDYYDNWLADLRANESRMINLE